MALSRRAVRRNIKRIIPRAPDRILYKPVQKLVVAGKVSSLLKIGADGNRLEIVRVYMCKALHEHILKAEDGKPRPIVIAPGFACVNNALQGRCDVLVPALNISLREFSVLIEHFPETKRDRLSLLRLYGKCKDPRDILVKIKHLLSRRRDMERSMQMLLRADRHIVARRRDYRASRYLRVPAVGRHASRLDDLAVLVVRKADRPVAAPRPGTVR